MRPIGCGEKISISFDLPYWAAEDDAEDDVGGSKALEAKIGSSCPCKLCRDPRWTSRHTKEPQEILLCGECQAPVGNILNLIKHAKRCPRCDLSMDGRLQQFMKGLQLVRQCPAKYAGIHQGIREAYSMNPIFDVDDRFDYLEFLHEAVHPPSVILKTLLKDVTKLLAYGVYQRGLDFTNFAIFWSQSTLIPAPSPWQVLKPEAFTSGPEKMFNFVVCAAAGLVNANKEIVDEFRDLFKMGYKTNLKPKSESEIIQE